MHPQSQQGVCADAIATLEGIDRDAVDDLALVSQARAAQAIAEGRFDKSLITVKNPDGTVALDHEEFPRPETTKEGLLELKTVFSMVRDVPVDEAGTTYGALIQQKYPRSLSSTISTMRATPRAWSTVRRHSCWPQRPTWKKAA